MLYAFKFRESLPTPNQFLLIQINSVLDLFVHPQQQHPTSPLSEVMGK